MFVIKTWNFSMYYYYKNVVFYSDKIFPNYGPDVNSAATLINTDTTDAGSRPPVLRVVRGRGL